MLALDLATTTGWCFGAPGALPKCGSLRFTKQGASRAETYREFRRWLNAKWAKSPDLIVYESPALPMLMSGRTNITTVRFLIGLAEHLEEWCHGRIELREARTADVRTHFIGGNPKSAIAKQAVFNQCKTLGWEVQNFDESDAAALWDYQVCWLNPRIAAHSTPLFRENEKPTT